MLNLIRSIILVDIFAWTSNLYRFALIVSHIIKNYKDGAELRIPFHPNT